MGPGSCPSPPVISPHVQSVMMLVLLSHCDLLPLHRSTPTLCCKHTPFWSTELVCPAVGVHRLFLLSPHYLLCVLPDLCTPAQALSPWEASLSFLGCPTLARMLSGPVCFCCWALGSRKTGTMFQHQAGAHRMETEWEDGYMVWLRARLQAYPYHASFGLFLSWRASRFFLWLLQVAH